MSVLALGAAAMGEHRVQVCILISHTVFTKLFGNSQFPHKSVKLSCIITNIKNKLTNLNGLLQYDFIMTFWSWGG